MKKFIKNTDWAALFLSLVYGLLFSYCLIGCCAEAHADELQGKCIVVSQKGNNKPIDTGYTIKVDGKIYKIYRGPKGGMYYIKGDKKVYLSKKQKALIK